MFSFNNYLLQYFNYFVSLNLHVNLRTLANDVRSLNNANNGAGKHTGV